jgi:hypothetical protein
MDVKIIEALIPITAIIVTFGFPVALVFVFKWFKLRDKELQLDAEVRKDQGHALEARVQRIESILLQLGGQPMGLMEPPPSQGTGLAGPDLPVQTKTRSV